MNPLDLAGLTESELAGIVQKLALAGHYADRACLSPKHRAIFSHIVSQRLHLGRRVHLTLPVLAQLVGCSQRTVTRALAVLKAKDLIFFGRGSSGRILHIMLSRKLFPSQAKKISQSYPQPARTLTRLSTIRPSSASAKQRKRDPSSESASSAGDISGRKAKTTATAQRIERRGGGWHSAKQLTRGLLHELAPPGAS